MTRMSLYLLSVLPVTWIILYLALLPAALLRPPDLVQQAILSLPLFCIGGGWIGGMLVFRFALPPHLRTKAMRRKAALFVGCLHLVLVNVAFGAILTGFATPTETFAILALILLVAHGVAFRRWTRT